MEIKKSTIVRAILVVLVIVNMILESCGIDVIPADESFITMFVETVIEIAIIAVSFWKNNSFTPKAIQADKFLKQLKESE